MPDLSQLMNDIAPAAFKWGLALIIFIGGWIIALAIRAIVRGILNKTSIDNQILGKIVGEKAAQEIQLEDKIAGLVYWLVLLFVVVAALNQAGLNLVAQPINSLLDSIFGYGSNALGALALLLIAWVVATGVRFALIKIFGATDWEEKLAAQAGVESSDKVSVSETLANIVYWLIFLFFLPGILDALNMSGMLAPVQGLVDQILSGLPNILQAGLTLFIGWFVARIVRQIVTSLLVASGFDKLGQRTGVEGALGTQTLSTIVGTVVYTLILIPVIISALGALNIPAISEPASNMLTILLEAIPAVFGAALILAIAYFVARLVSDLVANLLTGVGFNKVLTWVGFNYEATEDQRTPSEFVGYLVLLTIMLFSAIEAANMLGFTLVADMLAQIIGYAGQILVAVVVFGAGLYFANLARTVINATGNAQANFLGQAARLAIIIFSGALALRQTGIAEDIVNMAFGLLLGAIAVAAAIAFGFGGRDIAARELGKLVDSMQSKD